MKATFLQRFAAYIIDSILLSFVLIMLTGFFPNQVNIEELTKKQDSLTQELIEKQISYNDYNKQITEVTYKLDKEKFLMNITNIILVIGYFIFYQFYSNGQTIGKKLMKIRVKGENGILELNSLVIRSLFVDGLAITMISLLLITLLDKQLYLPFKNVLTMIEIGFLITVAAMILYRKDKRAIHDIITKTEVLREEK